MVTTTTPPTNQEIAEILERIADLLETQEANPFRVRAYRNAADTVRRHEESLSEMVKRGDRKALEDFPNIGEGIAVTIDEIVETGHSSQLDQLQAEISPVDLFKQVPGIGEELAERLVRQLDIHSLQELEMAAHDGRLESVEGFGERRGESVRMSLAGMLSPAARRRAHQAVSGKGGDQRPQIPPVPLLLEVDRQYRERAEAGDLRKIAPKRFNPKGEAWLPIMKTSANGWRFTALFSNTARAHDLDKTRDWVVIYYQQNGEEDQCTVVTETSGPIEGKRVIRGRERQCLHYYQRQTQRS